jgi:hypothetical protein
MAKASSERIDVSLGQEVRSDAKLEKEYTSSKPGSTPQIE